MKQKQPVNYSRSGISTNTQRVVGYSCIGLLGLLVLGLLFPPASSQSSALTNTSSDASTRLSVKAVETVSIRLAANMDLELEPHSTGSFGIANTELGITTNDPEGFEVFLSTTDSEAALRGVSDKISTIETNTLGSNFSGNTWGYSLSKIAPTASTTYSPLSHTNTSILRTDTATVNQEDVYNLGFGVHITPSLPAGEYSTSVVVSVVANPATISTLSDLVYMQDMDSTICQNTPSAYNHETGVVDKNSDYYLNPITKQLYDLRDGKKYWVAKLADGNCWMTQNLALVITEEMINTTGNSGRLNSLTTDIGYDADGNLIDGVKYWNQDSEIPPVATYLEKNEGLIGDTTIAQSWNFGNATFGSYYSFSAATASSGSNPGNYIAPDSVCPKGWKLPPAGDDDSITNGSYKYLFTLYGAWGMELADRVPVTSKPLNFAKGGDVRPTEGKESYLVDGAGGYYWTSRSYWSYVPGLYIGTTNKANHFAGSDRSYGKSLRCIAR